MEEALESIKTQVELFSKVIVVFEGNDIEYEISKKRFSGFTPNLEIHRLIEEKGLSHARNLAIEKCESEWIVFIDDDARLNSGYGESLRDAIEQFPRSAGFTGPILPEYSRGSRIFPTEMEWLVSCNTEQRKISPVRNGFGANMVFNRNLIVDANLSFSSDLGWTGGMEKSNLSGEETDFSIRLSSHHDLPIYWIPGLSVNHLVPKSRTNLGYVWNRSMKEGRTKATLDLGTGSKKMKKEYGHLIKSIFISIPREILCLPLKPIRSSWNILGISTMIAGTGFSFLKWKLIILFSR